MPENPTGQPDASLHDADSQYRHLFMQAPGLIAILRRREGVCELFNELFSKVWGNRDVLNKPMRQAWPELDGQGFFEIVERVFDTGNAEYGYEYPARADWHHTGKTAEAFFDFVYSPYRNQEGVIDGVMIFGMDVTARVQARKQLAEQQLLFKDITDAAATALWMVDKHGNITFVNQTWADWTGHPKEALLGRGWVDFVAHEDRERVISSYIREVTRKWQYHVDFRILRGDGKIQWVAATGKPRYLPDGEFAGYVGSCMDITERKKWEQILLDSEQRFRTIADSAPVLIWMSGPNKKTTFLNKSWTQFADESSLLSDKGLMQSDLIHKSDVEMVVEQYRRAFDRQREFYLEYRMLRNDGNYRWIGMKGVPRLANDGTLVGYIGSGMDITEMKEHEQVKNDFIGMASHELKTPITSIKAYVQLLLSIYKDADDEFLKKSLTTVNKQINKLTRLISDLLDVSKMESGRLSLNSEPFVLNDVLKETIEEVQHTAAHHDIVYTACSDTITVLADRDRIAQVLINFLTNAIKYSPEADRVDVNVTCKQNEAIIAVKDYGIGISAEEQNKIFNRFYRVEGRNEQTFSGFGIGLYVAAEIIKRHNGNTWVESHPGTGSVFYFSLPVHSTVA
ncbi:PAS domain-containing sensor histidine kinase [Mucilaginibacter sp. Bleaf8]|uniref:PAS domain-containing sensor histidine kinase n=1 Tax=Mucilaginibacter sp. Bleaf8 TaxID=2834430 RepID=UPI001BCCCC4C|nr:PAS domain-containing sensor histidine kinase [Mucilaginibacter sp. Bleaf8]MBS7565181.1 PAS domain-containing sensor histidine kinase [Mucilaginibacter sp. Bleaf8]